MALERLHRGIDDRKNFLRNLLSRMSPEEKVGQLNLLVGTMDSTGAVQSNSLEESIRTGRCGAVLNVYTPDATRALQEIALQSPQRIPLLFGYDVIHGHRTIYPIPLALSCSWNLELIERCARMAAIEAAADGLHWVFSPMVDICQDARWGRIAEGAGEDPWLGAKIAAALVRGYQGERLNEPTSVIACVKHFALYGASKAGRDYHSVDMSRREMEETYFPPYRAAVDAGARTVMTAFNEVDGIPATANRWLLTEILREKWGFQGWVVTDYTAVSELKNHGIAATDADAAKQAFLAGSDMDMVSEAYINYLTDSIHESQLDEAVLRILETKWDIGLFEDPFARCDSTHVESTHRQLALEAARESLVLLKNDGDLLPLQKRGRIAVVGPFANVQRELLGCWIAAGDASQVISPIAAIREIVGEHAIITDDITSADYIILMLGEGHEESGEAASKTDIRLSQSQRELAARILTTGKPCVLVTLSGRPLDLSWEAEHFPAMIHAWAPGVEGSRALAQVLFGECSPIAKLTISFPRHVGQLPMTYREKPSGRPFLTAEKYTSKYLDSPNDALFPFGHGLTYGRTHLGAVSVEILTDQSIRLSTQLTNLASRPVTETLQLYLRDLVASITRPVKELRGFQRIHLAAGETKAIEFRLTEGDLSFIGPDGQPIIEFGEFTAMIGKSSADFVAVTFKHGS